MNTLIISKKYIVSILLVLVLGSATFLRLYRLDTVPPSLSWDEAAVGYNAFTISHWGQDEWSRTFPITFKSFEDDKHPVHIYFTALSVGLLGLSEYTTRLPSALFGILNVLVVYFLARRMFNRSIGLVSAIFLTISPYNLEFSRFNHEANFALFFFMLGLLLFLKSIQRKSWLLLISAMSFGISLVSYQSSEVVLPLFLAVLAICNLNELKVMKSKVVVSTVVFFMFVSLFLLDINLLGQSRVQQNQISTDELRKTQVYKQTQNLFLGRLEVMGAVYLEHFGIKYLFVSGDSNARHSIQAVGEYYKTDAVLFILGLIWLYRFKSKNGLLLIVWALLAPIPAALSSLEPHAARSLFSMGSMHVLAACGVYQLFTWVSQKKTKIIIGVVIAFLVGSSFSAYLYNYYGDYSKKYAIEWQYGMKQIAQFSKDHKGYAPVYTTAERHQPYIFYLFYLQTPLPEFRKTVIYNNGSSRGYNLVSSFDKYHFGDWNFVDSPADELTLYEVTPYEYSGMRNRLLFDVKKVVKYPNGTEAFYLVSYP